MRTPIRLICFLLLGATTATCVAAMETNSQTRLRERFMALQDQLRTNQFGQPLVLNSTETPERLQGDVYAIVDHPLNKVSASLAKPEHWCDLMILHINTKYCHAVAGPSGTTLRVNIGGKEPEELVDSGRIEFSFKVATATSEFLAVTLAAPEGPMGTSMYRVRLEAIALPQAKTFMHLSYSYAVGFSGRFAMNVYLGTAGRNKVGFTMSGTQANGQTDFIGGTRGVVERNTMRYFLAIDSFLGAVDMAPEARLEPRLQSWFTAVERYPRQLHEMDRAEYLATKRAEYSRQQTLR